VGLDRHGMGGLWGALATGLFATTAINRAGFNGLFYGNPQQLVIQAVAAGIAIVYAFGVTFVLAKVLDATLGLRVSDTAEEVGLDLSEHEERFQDVKDALRAIGIVGLNVAEVRGHGRQGGITLEGRAGTYRIDMLPRLQLNIALSDHNVARTIETICSAVKTGSTGDGIIFVYPVDDVIRIRTGERGKDALHYEGDLDELRAAGVIGNGKK